MTLTILLLAAAFLGFFYNRLFLGIRKIWSFGLKSRENYLHDPQVAISIVIAFRNEEKNLPELFESIRHLTYPPAKIEIIWVDDHSDDQSSNLLSAWIPATSMKQSILFNEGTGKKSAVRMGIKHAQNEIILLTDADVVLPVQWIETMLGSLTPELNAVCGPVMFNSGNRFFDQWLQLDFAALVSTGASYLKVGTPVMANGANILIRKEAYLHALTNISGDQYASGDDVFLVQNLHPKSVTFCFDPASMVKTHAPENFKALLEQRIRWASKAKGYTNKESRFLSLFVFIFHLVLSTSFGLSFFMGIWVPVFLILFIFKLFTDYKLFKTILPFYSIDLRFLDLIKSEFMQMIYIPLVGILSPWYRVKWKARRI